MQGQLSGCFTSKAFQYPPEDSAVIMFRSQKGELGHIDVYFNIPDDCALLRLEVYGTPIASMLSEI